MDKNLVIGILIIMLLIVGFFIYNYQNKEQIIGGCAGVHPDYIEECCENWAQENNLFLIHCDGKWIVEESICKWECNV